MRETQNHTFNKEISNSLTTGLSRGPVSLSHRVGRQILRVLLYIRLYFLPLPNCMWTSKADYCFVVLCLMVAYDVLVTSPDTLWEERTQKHVTDVLFSDTRTKGAPTKVTKKKKFHPHTLLPMNLNSTTAWAHCYLFFQKLYLLFSYVNECLVCSHICVACLPFACRRWREHWVSYNWSHRWL